MSAVENSILWSSLTSEQKEQGVHPAQLGALKFNIAESELSPDMLQRLERFFLGCRMAASDADFVSKSIVHLHPNEPSSQLSNQERTIQTLVERVLLVQVPQENRVKKGDLYDGTRHEPLYDAYNRMVESDSCFLMHPARRSELIESLGTTFVDAEFAADQLITYRCFGYDALKILKLERSLQEKTDAWLQVRSELSALAEKGPQLITHPMELKEEDLACIRNESVRKYVCLGYRELASKGKLEILDLPVKELFDAAFLKAHPCLDSLMKEYDKGKPLYAFLTVIGFLQTLRNSDLNALKEYQLNGRLDDVDDWLGLESMALSDAKMFWNGKLGVLNGGLDSLNA